jgi:hypothetical protein
MGERLSIVRPDLPELAIVSKNAIPMSEMILPSGKNGVKNSAILCRNPDLPHIGVGPKKHCKFCLLLRQQELSPRPPDELVSLFLQANKASFSAVKMSVQKRIRRYNSAMSRMRPEFFVVFCGFK